MTRSPIERIILISLLSALALVVNLAESAFPLPFPGMRLGIANVFSLTALMTLGASAAVFVSALRVVMAFMISGNPFALACSVGGLLCSLPLTVVLYRRFGKIFSVEAISVAAAAAFNAGQLSVVVLITGELSLFGYLPFLTLAALMTGFGVGAVARTLSARLSSLPIRTDEE